MKKSCKRLLSLTLLAMLGLSACNGNVGNAGVKGGTQWLTGTEVPTELTGGNVGDFYFDVDDNDIYQLTDDGWVLLTNIKGDKGDTGAQGEKGDKGDTGAQGEKGDKGDTGAQGEKGDKGDTGAQGEKGDKGDTGAQGEKGDKGDTGAQGEKGDKGDTGAQGEKGDKGDTGAQGEKGDKGDKGEDGLTPYIGANGNWWIGDQDTGVKAEGKDGVDGQPGTPGDKGDTGDKGEDGVSVENIDIEYGVDEKGNDIIIFTITYSDGRKEVIKTLVPKKIKNVFGLTNNMFKMLQPNEACEYKLMVDVNYDDDSFGTYEIKEEDIIGGYVDFYNEGIYKIDVNINGIYQSFEICVYNQENANLVNVDLHNSKYKVGVTYDDIMVNLSFEIQTDLGSHWYTEEKTLREVTSVQDQKFDEVGFYNVEVQYKDYYGKISFEIYDPEVCNISTMYWDQFGSPRVQLGTDEKNYILNNVVGTFLSVSYYEPYNGTLWETIQVTEEMIDYSYMSFDELGMTSFIISYALKGQDPYSIRINVEVYSDEVVEDKIVDAYFYKATTEYNFELGTDVERAREMLTNDFSGRIRVKYESGKMGLLPVENHMIYFDFDNVDFKSVGTYEIRYTYYVDGFGSVESTMLISILDASAERKIVDAKVFDYEVAKIPVGTSAEEAREMLRENCTLDIEVFYEDGSSEFLYDYKVEEFNFWDVDFSRVGLQHVYFDCFINEFIFSSEIQIEIVGNEDVKYEIGNTFIANNFTTITTSDSINELFKNISERSYVELTLFGSDGSIKNERVEITEDMIITKNIEFGKVGRYNITIGGYYEGMYFGAQYVVEIIPDLSDAKIENTYKFTPEAQDMFGFTSLDVYDNGCGVLHDLNNWDTYFEIEIDEEGRFTYNNVIFQITEDGLVSQYISNEEPVVSYYWDAREAMSMEYVFYFYEELKESGEYLCTLEMISDEGSQSATATVVYDAKNNTLDVGGIILQINEDGTLTMCE